MTSDVAWPDLNRAQRPRSVFRLWNLESQSHAALYDGEKRLCHLVKQQR
jgi:hypothetical protein